MALHPAGRLDELAPGTVRVLDIGEKRIALCRCDGAVYAIDDVCTHDGGPLDQGALDGCEIECPRHGARFDVTTGRVTRLPAVRAVKVYRVVVEDGAIAIEV